ncbi:hypothetical protein CSHISOI_10761 [Colletotrichum shisoi]|uniref:Uncharacterized protein n=1 Tax=Colletotrichum shisoi TaxID=2078593 RepID=A0A5Q4BCK1_9PEZI|nr:hypothetical protein CSHISOI_10761 [Colletotrichum shisoi]
MGYYQLEPTTYDFTVGWGTLQVAYVVEILPFHLRAKSLVLQNLFVALALIFNQYANPIGVTSAKWRYYITYDVWLAFPLHLFTGSSSYYTKWFWYDLKNEQTYKVNFTVQFWNPQTNQNGWRLYTLDPGEKYNVNFHSTLQNVKLTC